MSDYETADEATREERGDGLDDSFGVARPKMRVTEGTGPTPHRAEDEDLYAAVSGDSGTESMAEPSNRKERSQQLAREKLGSQDLVACRRPGALPC